VQDEETAKAVVAKLMTLTDRMHACDTEAIGIDLKVLSAPRIFRECNLRGKELSPHLSYRRSKARLATER
jgi:hypothetical protein